MRNGNGEGMNTYINKDDAVQALKEWQATNRWDEYYEELWEQGEDECCSPVDVIAKLLPADVVKRRKGKWIWMGDKGDSRFMCSVCKWKEEVPTCMGVPNIWEYCPSCGSYMREETKDDND